MDNKENIYCIGIGGIGLSGLAQILHEQGHNVSGSDMEDSFILEQMRKDGINIYIGHKKEYLPENTNRVIYSSAIPENNPELKKAKQSGLILETYAEAIKRFTQNKYTIAVCGTHGKTTVTGFISLALMAGEKDPTVVIGSNLKEFNNKNYLTGKSDLFVVEACEYKRNFLYYEPNIIVITNIEEEHLDYFKDLEDYKSAYKEFIAKLPDDGYIIANYDDPNVMDVISDFKGNKILFSNTRKDCDWYTNNNEIWKTGEKIAELDLKIPGDFNMLNALCGLIVGQILNVDREKILQSFKVFTGAWRRFEILGNLKDMTIINDYAHHPTAIKKTLEATKNKYPDKNICCVFQPHQYNRTKHFLHQFAESFQKAKYVIVPDIYKVRDKKEDTENISEKDLVAQLNQIGINALNIKDYQGIKEFLEDHNDEIDIVIIMGAGDIWKLGNFLLQGPPDFCTVCDD